MPKTSRLETLRQTRNLLVGNTLAKWYLTCVTILLERCVEPFMSDMAVFAVLPADDVAGRFHRP
eukprot:4295995-Pyramimonas_sp.AAC.1